MKHNYSMIMLSLSVFLLAGIKATEAQKLSHNPRANTGQTRDILRLNPEQEADAIKYLAEYHQDQVKEIYIWKEKRPQAYQLAISRAYRQKRRLDGMKEDNPEQYKKFLEEKQMEAKSRTLAKQYQRSNEENERERIKEELSMLLDKLFEYRQMNRQLELERLEKRITELKINMSKRLEQKDQIIELRLKKLLGEGQILEW